MRNKLAAALVFLFSGVSAFVYGQTPDAAIKPTYMSGDVAAISEHSVVITTKSGPVEAMFTDKTAFKRVSAATLDLAAATPGALTDISVGDKVTVSALQAADGKSLNARSVYFVTKADLAAKNAKESEEWRKRGITGRVASVNPQTDQIVVEMRSLMGSTNLTLTPKANAKFLRYAQDSIRYDEAVKSSISEVKVGDELRALGDKSTDGTGFAAEQVLTGAFQTIAGIVKSVDVATNEVVIKDLKTTKDVTVVISDTSLVKRFPAEMAERMAGFQAGGARPAGAPGQAVAAPAGQATPPGQAPGGARPGFGGRGGVDEMLERFPTITATDLKVGDMIAISSTKTSNMDRIKAIKLLAGVEPFIRMAQATSGGGGRGQGGVQGGFSIPGLDGIGFP